MSLSVNGASKNPEASLGVGGGVYRRSCLFLRLLQGGDILLVKEQMLDGK